MMNRLTFKSVCGGILLSSLLLSAGQMASAQQTEPAAPDWRDDWELAENLTMEIDTQGYSFPSHITFVPEPGTAPDDPLYFVTELKGTIKVVTNDRKVHTFARDVLPVAQGPNSFDQVGLTGLCLEPERGYVFVSFAYLDNTQIYRNGMARFTTTPGTFGLSGTDRLDFLDLFRDERSASAHQIGPCQVADGYLYTAVGYGDEQAQAQNIHSTLGSIIRTDLDFQPPTNNPFFEDDGKDTAVDYIWAYGVRNVFGLKSVGDRLFATENGGDIDRFNEIDEGENYLWDGTDWAIGARAAQAFAPSIGVVDLDFIGPDNELFPERFRNKFVATSSGLPGTPGPSSEGRRTVFLLDYDFDERRMAGPPEEILRFRGAGLQLPVSVALGPDGLYFLPILPNSSGIVAVYRITHAPDAEFPHRIGQGETPLALINRYGCRQCHRIAGTGGNFGPALQSSLFDQLDAKVNAPDYPAQVAEVDKLEGEPFTSYRDARQKILSVTDEERVHLWLSTYLQEPTFDDPRVRMPRLDVTPEHAAILATHLLSRDEAAAAEEFGILDRIRFYIAAQIPELRYRHMIFSFGVGGLLGGVIVILAFAHFLSRRRRDA